jgi:PAS domain S-box-containing protein
MKKPKNSNSDSADLRRRAEEHISKAQLSPAEQQLDDDARKLLHELQVHQIELELQNEALSVTKAEVEELVEKYQSLYDFAPSGFITLSEQGEILELNHSAARMLKEDRTAVAGKKFESFILPESRLEFNHCFQDLFRNKKGQTCEFTLSNRLQVPIQVTANGILDQHLALCHLTLVDITENKIAERKLKEAKLRAEESERLKSAFLANMSHEIRTPMNGILGFLGLLRDPQIGNEEFNQYLDIIEKSGSRLLNIINDVIDISKIESGSMKLVVSDTNINEQIKYLHTFFKPQVDVKNLNFFTDSPLTGKEALIKTDREKLIAILTNLIKNAIKYTNTGAISFGYLKKDAYLEFFVRDTGIGIPNNQHEFIFDRFSQVENVDLKVEEGTGLGLAISRAYAEILGGQLWVESDFGKGSTFYFTIPYLTESPAEPSGKDTIQHGIGFKVRRRLKVLVVDDEATSNFLLSILVRKHDHDVIEASNGQEAIDALRENSDIDLVLMDIRMPILNGHEATKKIREFNKEVIIIAQTAFCFPEDREKALNAGCNDIITKPIDKTVLFELLKTYFKDQ